MMVIIKCAFTDDLFRPQKTTTVHYSSNLWGQRKALMRLLKVKLLLTTIPPYATKLSVAVSMQHCCLSPLLLPRVIYI